MIGKSLLIQKQVSAKDSIIKILSEEFPLSGKQVWIRLGRQYGKSVSYQATHKSLQKLVFDGVVIKENCRYSVSLQYVEQMVSFLRQLRQGYERMETGIEPIEEKLSRLIKEVKHTNSVLQEVQESLQKEAQSVLEV